MSASSLLGGDGKILAQFIATVEPPAPTPLPSATETTLYGVGILANRTNDTFTPDVSGVYNVSYDMTYAESFGDPSGGFSEVTFSNGTPILSLTGRQIVLPVGAAVRRVVASAMLPLVADTAYSFNTTNSGYTTPAGCGMGLNIYGPL
jgi:hypothetical protein